MNSIRLLVLVNSLWLLSPAQTGYDLKINFKNCPDTTVYLARYYWDQLPIMDSCKKVRNGKIEFKGKQPLDKGVYFLANQGRSSYYFQFIVDAQQRITITADNADVPGTLKADEKQNQQFFDYIRFMTAKNKEMMLYSGQTRTMTSVDSAKFMSEKQKQATEQITKYDKEFMTRNK